MKILTNKGVTLVELLIYLGLSMIILVVLSELFVAILNESVKTQNYSAVQTDGRYVLGRLKMELNKASSVTTPGGLGEVSTELSILVDGFTHHYFVTEEKLYLNISPDPANYLVSNLDSRITNVFFTRTGNVGGKSVILIEFTSTTGIEGTAQYESQIFKGAGGLR